jgi:4-hydroxy-3-polyprenylbenzoate decarboxylase
MKKLVVGISGATGAVYGIRLIEVLSRNPGVEVHLVISEAGAQIIMQETDWTPEEVMRLARFHYAIDDIGAPLSSGSFLHDGMVIAPGSIKSMSMIANSICSNLLTRAADVTLKEKRKLILLIREAPLHLGHLRQMVKLAEMGAVIHPPLPAFYFRPKSVDDIVNHTVGRILDHLGVDHNLFRRWEGAGKTRPRKSTKKTERGQNGRGKRSGP